MCARVHRRATCADGGQIASVFCCLNIHHVDFYASSVQGARNMFASYFS